MKITGIIKEGCAGPDGLREYHVDLETRASLTDDETRDAIQTLDSLIDGEPESDLGRMLTPIKGLLVARERRVTSWEDVSEELAARIRRYDRKHS